MRTAFVLASVAVTSLAGMVACSSDSTSPPGPSSSSSSGSSSSTTSSSGSSSTSSSGGTSSQPTSLIVSGTFASDTKATHVNANGGTTVASNVTVSATPAFSPGPPAPLPDVSKPASVNIKSPSKGSCNATIGFTLNGTQAAVTITAQDTLPATDCATFTDAVASQGILAELIDAPYPGTTAKAKVTFDLEP